MKQPRRREDPARDEHLKATFANAMLARVQARAAQIQCLEEEVNGLGGRLTPVSLELPQGLSFEQYRGLTQLLPPLPPGNEDAA